MPADTLAYLLLALDLLVVAAILTAPLLLLWAVVARLRRRRAPRRDAEGNRLSQRRREEQAAQQARVDDDDRVLRRCEACSTLWKGREGERLGRTSLRVRRWVRRRSRSRSRSAPGWARRQGWSRCPSCLSTQVRTSSASRR